MNFDLDKEDEDVRKGRGSDWRVRSLRNGGS